MNELKPMSLHDIVYGNGQPDWDASYVAIPDTHRVVSVELLERAAIPDPCEWLQDEWDNSYGTSCGNKYQIIDGTPEDNGMNFCTYCGGKLETITGDATRAETRGKHE
jgi:hypothetical protein